MSATDEECADRAPGWDADTRLDRAPGLLMRALTRGVPAIGRVAAQAEPYAAAWRDHNRRAVAGTGRRWVVLGDSMSQGVGASAYDAGWVGQLRTRLAADSCDLDVVNLSATGARTTDVLAQQLPVLESLPVTVDGAPPALVTVLVGSNDLFGGRAARSVLPAAMAELVARVPRGTVISTLPQPARSAQLANLPLERAAEQGRIRLVDMRTAGPSSWRGRLAEDRFHPNDAGYDAIASAFEPVLRAALAQVEG